MIVKLAFCLFLICIEGGIEDRLKAGGGGRNVAASLGHGSCLVGEMMLVDGREGHCSLMQAAGLRPHASCLMSQ